jgi:hypothetical protein
MITEEQEKRIVGDQTGDQEEQEEIIACEEGAASFSTCPMPIPVQYLMLPFIDYNIVKNRPVIIKIDKTGWFTENHLV